jgi:MFS family permease
VESTRLIPVADIVSLKDRGKFQGISGGVVALSNSLGPILGGIFTEKLGWRYCFYITLPFTCVSLVVIIFVLPLRKVAGSVREKLKKIDYAGSVLTLVWAMLVILALSWAGTTYSWTSPAVLVPLIVGIVLGAVFVVMEAKWIPLPLIPMHIFKNATVSASMATTFANGVGFFVTLYYLPQYLQVVRGLSPLAAAIDMLPLTFIQTFFVFL